MVVGAILFEVNYILDCVDGTVARVKKLTSPLGAYLDPMLDRLRIVVLTLSLAWGQYISSGSTTTVLLVFFYLGLNNLILFSRSAQEKALAKRGQDGRLGVDLVRSTSGGGIVSWWFDVTSKRNMMPYYHDIELDALVFVVGPLMNMVVPFLVVANVLAVMLVILLNIMFLQSLWRDQRMKDNA
jgi:phosphatidylglycerophosphate synthase